MTNYTAPTQDMAFVLHHIARLPQICDLPDFDPIAAQDLQSILDEAGRFTSEVVAPTNRIGDTQGSTRNPDGSVTTPPELKSAYRSLVEAGWSAAPFDPEYGGGNLPWVLGCVFSEMLASANLAFSLCPMLTQGAVDMLEGFGSQDQKQRWLPKLISGEWAGTMNLTEPQAGSDVGALTTKAVRQPDGSYRITGQKIFITWGEHDLTENIVHLVLARTPDAPPGTKGISCFIAPKFQVAPDGSLGQRNDIHCVSIEHKLGIHASPTCVLEYGGGAAGAADGADGDGTGADGDADGDGAGAAGNTTAGAIAEIIGEEQQGMRYMFRMMNKARLSVGIEGLALGERAFQQALDFAQERRQGRSLKSEAVQPSEPEQSSDTNRPSDTNQPSNTNQQIPIVAHPNVKRMLLTMKSVTEAMRCLIYYTAAQMDLAAHSPDPDTAARAQERADLLIPLCKAWCTDWGNELTSLNIQIHGGMGYVEETGAAQLYRDIRIAAIYEGTNGIQALDLIGRKLPMRGGEALADLLAEIGEVQTDDLEKIWPPIDQALAATTEASQWLAENPGEPAMAGASPYLKLLASLVAGWLMAKSAVAAQAELARLEGGGDSPSGDSPTADPHLPPNELRSKIKAAEFFCAQILPTATALVPAITSGDEPLGAIDELVSAD